MHKMRFCPNCENILIPRNKKLYCKVCNKEFDLNPDCLNEYRSSKHILNEVQQNYIVSKDHSIKSFPISNELRKAYEDFFIK
jgi:DNA-directed RNA polymerase subunit M/transcription elongation factor TFIIS